MTNTKNTPIEVLERTFPLREVLEDVTVSLTTERRVSQPWGLAGGEPGATGENWLLPGGYERLAKRLPDKCTAN